MKKVFITGGTSWNSIITLDEFPSAIPQTIHNCEFKESIGNTAASKAMTISKLGFETTLHSLLGDDEFKDKITPYLDIPNLKFIFDLDENGTERHLNIMNGKGERISIFMNPGSDNPDIDYNKFTPYIEEADYVVINISNYCRNLLPICKKLNKEIWTDLHDYDSGNPYHQDFIDASDYIFLSSDNLIDYRPFMQTLIKKGKRLVVCTHGKKGATAIDANGNWYEVPIINDYKVVETNGAGDSFFSGYLYAFNQGYEIEKCLRYATISAGLCVSSAEISNSNVNVKFLKKEYQRIFE